MAVCMDETLDNAIVEQTDELLVLQSIYEENFHLIQEHDQDSNACIEFNITLNVHHPYEKITIEAVINEELCAEFEVQDNFDNNNVQNNDSHTVDDVQATYSKTSSIDPSTSSPKQEPQKEHLHIKGDFSDLTPINLWCRFPNLYPMKDPPQAIISCDWLSSAQVKKLSEVLHQLWQENCYEPIVFTWADWLQNSSWEFLELPSHIILREGFKGFSFKGRNDGFTDVALEMSLLNIFLKGRPICGICFDAKEGQEFFWFDKCYHFCCQDCLKLHCEMHIKSGSVLQLLCPINDCDAAIAPDVLKGILEEDTYRRWERLLLSRTLDMMPDLFYCPRCNAAVVAHEDVALSRLGQCASCYFAFCTECHGPWHHGKACTEVEELEENYQNKEEKEKNMKKDEEDDDENETPKENKFSAFNLLMMKMRLSGYYKKCPRCQTIIEKNGGCSHMHCTQCNCDFCWNCEKTYEEHGVGCNPVVVAPPPPKLPTQGELIIEKYKEKNPEKKVRTKYCPTCSQKNLKVANNNHLKCWSCKIHFCYKCGKKIQGTSYKHFVPPNTCTQHSDD